MKPCRRMLLMVLMLGGLPLTMVAEAQGVDPVRYAIVKAGYVLNLLRLTQWPETAFASEESPYVVQVVGEPAMTPFLEAIVRDERIGDRAVILRRRSLPVQVLEQADLGARDELAATLRSAHLVFVATDALPHLSVILAAVDGYPVLTVSDIPAFATRAGGMVGLVVREGNVRLEANVRRLEASGVNLSSRVLQLASLVDE